MVESASILVAVDFSEHGDEAVRQADQWARLHGWEPLFCHVAPRTLGVHMLFPQQVEQDVIAQPEAQLRLESLLRERVSALTGRPADELNIVIDSGAPAVTIVDHAEKSAARLLAIGSHSHSRLKYVFLGDVAERVVRHAPGSVLVARPHAPTGRILVATDFSTDAQAATELAADHARRCNARLTLACSIEKKLESIREMANLGSGYGFVRDEYAEARREAEQRLAAQLAAAAVAGETLVLEGSPAASIVHAAAEADADLLVIGASGRTGFSRMLLGSVAEKVARAAPCSVLVVRASTSG